LKKLLQHWMKHNNDHVKTCQEWTAKIRQPKLRELLNSPDRLTANFSKPWSGFQISGQDGDSYAFMRFFERFEIRYSHMI